MKIVISCFGKFHADFLARHLQQRGLLVRVFTANPRFNSRVGISRGYIRCLPLYLITWTALRLCFPEGLFERINWACLEIFDWWVSRQIRDCDIFIGWSSGCLKSIRFARQKGIVTVVMRTSSHIAYQKEIVEEEYRRLKINKRAVYDKVLNKELKEYEEADYIQVQSGFSFDSFVSKGVGKTKLIKLATGVSLKDFYPAGIHKDEDTLTVLYVGSISVRKGIIYLLEAVRMLYDKKIRLILIGRVDRDFSEIFKRYAGIYTHIGCLTQEELRGYFNRASVFVQPSLEEGLSYVIIEALACGVPVIATTNTGASDVYKDGRSGFIIPPCDSNAIAEKILYLYDNPKLRKALAENAVAEREEFSWERYGEKAIEAYNKIHVRRQDSR